MPDVGKEIRYRNHCQDALDVLQQKTLRNAFDPAMQEKIFRCIFLLQLVQHILLYEEYFLHD